MGTVGGPGERHYADGKGEAEHHLRDGGAQPAGDGVPDGTRHWFDMGPAPSFTAIRFFTEPDGWIGHFTGTDIAKRFPRFERSQAG